MAGQASKENGKKGGRPKGVKNGKTLEKERILRALRDKIMRSADRLFQAQMVLATGMSYLYRIDKKKVTGPDDGVRYVNEKPVQVVRQSEIEEYLMSLGEEGDATDQDDPEAAYYFITTVAPQNKAIDSMFDRTFGKPAQPLSNPDTPLMVQFDNSFSNATPSKTETNSPKSGKV